MKTIEERAKYRCDKELYVIEYFGLPEDVSFNKSPKVVYADLVDMLAGYEQRIAGATENISGWTRLVDLLATHGGSIVSTASLSPEWIEQAKASNRMYVNEDGLGFVWEPDIKGIPETVEEVEWFEKWYPLKIELPEKFKTLDWMHKLPSNSNQVK